MKPLLYYLTCVLAVVLWGWAVPVYAQQQTQSAVFGTVQVHPNGGKLAIYQTLTFVSGYVITPRPSPTDNISFRPGSGYAGASDGSHVNGYTEVVGSSAFMFPIGDGTSLRPAGISAPPTSGTYSAAYFYSDPGAATLPTGGPFSRTALGTGLDRVSSTEYWDINGPGAVNLTLTWYLTSNIGANFGTNNSSLLTIAGWDGIKWVDLGGTATGDPLQAGSITTTTPVVPDQYTAFTLARKSAVTPTSPSTTCGIVIHGPTDVEVHPGGTMVVYCDVTFVDGYVNTPRNMPNDNIVFMPGTTWFMASDDSHVNGYAEKVGNTAFTFPVGDGSALRTVTMSAPGSLTSTYQAAYFSTNPASATQPTGTPFATSSWGTGVTAVSQVEYWDVNGNAPVDLTFTWDANSDLNTLTGGTLANLIMVGWDGSKWVDLGSPTTTGTLSGTGTLMVPGITPSQYTAYTFGAKGATATCPNPSVGGTVAVAGTHPLCSTANSGTLTLSGQTGNVLRWETSTDGGSTWANVSGTSTTLAFSNVLNNQQYRAVVNAGGSCADANATPVTLTTSAGACAVIANCDYPASVITK